MINYELLSINKEPMTTQQPQQSAKEPLYHNRTLAVTEANALTSDFKFNLLKYS